MTVHPLRALPLRVSLVAAMLLLVGCGLLASGMFAALFGGVTGWRAWSIPDVGPIDPPAAWAAVSTPLPPPGLPVSRSSAAWCAAALPRPLDSDGCKLRRGLAAPWTLRARTCPPDRRRRLCRPGSGPRCGPGPGPGPGKKSSDWQAVDAPRVRSEARFHWRVFIGAARGAGRARSGKRRARRGGGVPRLRTRTNR